MISNLHTDRDAFVAFIDSQFGEASRVSNLEDALAEFRAYQQELASVRAKVNEAKTSSLRGESKELEVEELIQEVSDELSAEGIRD